MKKIIIFLFVVILLLFCCFSANTELLDKSQGTITAPKKSKLFDGSQGTGIESDPYRIISKIDLEDIIDAVNDGNYFAGKYFTLLNDITDTITRMIKIFYGNFHGNDKVVTVNINYPDSNNVGFFGYTVGANISNLAVAGNIVGNKNVGGIIGCAYNSSVSNCSNSANIKGKSTVGGIVGAVKSIEQNINIIDRLKQKTSIQVKDYDTNKIIDIDE